MENSYGIGVTNRYALFLDDESDPLETLFQKQQEKELKKKTKVAEKENKVKPEPAKTKIVSNTQKKPTKETTATKPQEKRDDNKINQRANADGKTERSSNKLNSETREERNNRRNREERPYNGPSENRDRENRPRRENSEFENRNNRDRGERVDRADRGERGERGDRGERGERGDRGERKDGRPIGNRPGGPRGPRKTFDDRRGKREFDRQSGSDKTHGYRGVKPIEKRDGAGAHNWGSTKDLILSEVDRPSDADQTWGENEKPEISSDIEKKEETEVEQTPVEEEPKELTLDEWKAQRAGRAKPQYNIRKAGEGEDLSQWKKMFELKKKEKDEESEEEEYDASEYPQRVGRQKHILDIDIQFYDNRRPGGGRGRGGPRGGRGGARGSRGPAREKEERRFRDEPVDEKAPRAPKVDDERDFPSLG
ncbi:SERPINE1 mRNA-binding protein 1 isoform X2 [Euwallacea similis]|uniref:SERPINE1 mRNA-binding protein 1 isoform X2 n=1 Tax=Euwallacea similis TaxID=1736056 RepID=UPI00344F17CB